MSTRAERRAAAAAQREAFANAVSGTDVEDVGDAEVEEFPTEIPGMPRGFDSGGANVGNSISSIVAALKGNASAPWSDKRAMVRQAGAWDDSKVDAAKKAFYKQQAMRQYHFDNKEQYNDQFPLNDYGRITIPYARGTAEGQQTFGLTAKLANATQKKNRSILGFTGHGQYQSLGVKRARGFSGRGSYLTGDTTHYTGWNGNGGFFSNLWGGIKDVVSEVGGAIAPIAKEVVGMGVKEGLPLLIGALGKGEYIMPAAEQEAVEDMIVSHPAGVDLANHVLNMGQGIQPDGRAGNPEFNTNDIINPGSRASRTNPTISSVGDETDDVYFSFKEYIKDIVSIDTNFKTVEKIELNPGLSDSFPLLSQFAQHFEEYDFDQLIFHFKSLVTAGNAEAAGAIMMVTIDNPSSTVLTSKRAIESTGGVVSGSVAKDLWGGVECDNSKKALGGQLFVRTTDVPREQRRTYDMGFLQVAIQGCPANFHIGELWVEYKVRLSKIKMADTPAIPVGSGLFMHIENADPATHNQLFGGIAMDQVSDPAPFFGSNSFYTIFPSFTGLAITNPTSNSTRFVCDAAVTSGQKYLLTFEIGQLVHYSLTDWIWTNNNSATINLIQNAKSTLHDHNVMDPSTGIWTVTGTLKYQYLLDMRTTQFVQGGTLSIDMTATSNSAPDTFLNGIANVSLIRVSYDFEL